jgi:hypothetical protein
VSDFDPRHGGYGHVCWDGCEVWDLDENDTCQACDGSGEILVCVDDICHGIGECIHGDGMRMCTACQGNG